MPAAKTKTSKSSSSSSSAAAPAAAAKSLKAAGKQKATEKPSSTAEAPTTKKRVRIESAGSSKPAAAVTSKAAKVPKSSAAPEAAKVAKSSTSTSTSKTAATKPKTKATVASAKPPAKKLKKSPLTSTRPVSEAATVGEDSDDDSLDSDEEAELLKGVSAPRNVVAEDEAGSSDEDDEDVIALKKYATSPSSIPTLKLPSSRDDAAVRARLDRLSSRRQSSKEKSSSSSASSSVKPGALYVGRLPRHFTELPLRKYFEQFGTITRLRLSRNKKTGASKHYAFIEFADEEVAKIVQETMDNYLILNQLLSVKLLPREDIHPRLWIGANRTYRPIPKGRRARVQHDAPKTVEQKEKVERRLVERQQRKKSELKELGIDYDFEGYAK